MGKTERTEISKRRAVVLVPLIRTRTAGSDRPPEREWIIVSAINLDPERWPVALPGEAVDDETVRIWINETDLDVELRMMGMELKATRAQGSAKAEAPA